MFGVILKESCEELNELAIDLIDYCYRLGILFCSMFIVCVFRNLNELVGHDYQQDDYEGKCSSDETPETITKVESMCSYSVYV